MSIVLGGKRLEIPGVQTVSWLDDPKRVPQAKGQKRTTFPRAVVAHTVHGKRCARLKPGGKPSRQDEWYARFQTTATPPRSWDFTVDTDGSVAWSNDPAERYTWHAGHVNGYTVGFEMVQDQDGAMYEDTIVAAARVVCFLVRALGIQPQVFCRNGAPHAGRIPRLDPDAGGRNLVGVYGHRNVFVWPTRLDPATGKRVADKARGVVATRGPGDPNDFLFEALVRCGFEAFDPLPPAGGGDPEDVRVWKGRQKVLLGFEDAKCDGVPGPATRAGLEAKGYRDGLFAQVTPP